VDKRQARAAGESTDDLSTHATAYSEDLAACCAVRPGRDGVSTATCSISTRRLLERSSKAEKRSQGRVFGLALHRSAHHRDPGGADASFFGITFPTKT